jgi:outer membrane protein assembly factor BamB
MRLLFATSLCLLLSPLRAEDSWTQFRGPNGTGVSSSTGLPTTFDEKTNVVWKTAIHGKGWSSPVVLGKQIWLTTAPEDGTTRSALCIDRDSGKIVHDLKLFDVPKPLYTDIPFNSHASPSPVIEQGRVYVHFGAAGTACLSTETGKVLWQRTDLLCNHWRGPGSSPILWEDLLILTFDGYDQQYTVALRKADGSTAWKRDRIIDYKTDNGDLKKAYCTPSVFTIGGKAQLISPSAGGTTSYDPRTGKELWKVNHEGKTMNVATPPLLGDGKVLVTTGNPATLVAIRPTGSGNVTDSHVAWTYRKQVPTRPAPLLLDGLVYMVSDQGFASCVDLKGTEVWTKRLGGNFTASPVCAEGHLYFFDQQEGKSFVLAAGRVPKVLATNHLDAGCMATPAIAGKALFVRTRTHLYRIERK